MTRDADVKQTLSTTLKYLWLIIFFAVLIWSGINPKDYFTWFLEVIARVNRVHHIGSDVQKISIHQAGLCPYIDPLHHFDGRRSLHIRRGASV